MRNNTASRFGLFLGLPAALLVLGCAGKKPVGTVAQAELAIDHAQRNQATEYALPELESAQRKLTLARDAMADGENDEARRLAEQAFAEAQLAEAKAQSGEMKDQVSAQVAALRAEASSMGLVSTTTTYTAPPTRTTVIQQKPNVVVVP